MNKKNMKEQKEYEGKWRVYSSNMEEKVNYEIRRSRRISKGTKRPLSINTSMFLVISCSSMNTVTLYLMLVCGAMQSCPLLV